MVRPTALPFASLRPTGETVVVRFRSRWMPGWCGPERVSPLSVTGGGRVDERVCVSTPGTKPAVGVGVGAGHGVLGRPGRHLDLRGDPALSHSLKLYWQIEVIASAGSGPGREDRAVRGRRGETRRLLKGGAATATLNPSGLKCEQRDGLAMVLARG